MHGLKFCYLDFSKIAEEYSSLVVFVDGREIVQDFISEAVMRLPKILHVQSVEDYNVVGTRTYFDQFVIELES